MPADEATKDAATTAVTLLGGGGLAVTLGVFLRGFFSGAPAQEKDTRDGLAQRNKTLEDQQDRNETRMAKQAELIDGWRYRALQARLEAEKLGYDRTLWPPDPTEGP
ncbi:hypothetical protein GO986_09110 [Deinococcus sp. HMF7620]|uniref:Uncharacterized protein n=1 Tax=Deinococcus arboris TaxID=2682977 RepID=A0A7C9M8G8_9DEIO|nr:hypothetical protein [Deinococcus arboris]MVN86923.1 hypothetical protein [Deinococcus arboris]